jgi:hypothetical protein
MLTEDASVAVWDGNKVITAAAISVWGIEVLFLIHGKSLPFLLRTI